MLEDAEQGETIPQLAYDGSWNRSPDYMVECESGVALIPKDPAAAERLMLSAERKATKELADWWEKLEIYYHLGKMYYEQKRDKEAVSMLEKALVDIDWEQHPHRKFTQRSGNIYCMLSDISLGSGDAAKALKYAEDALEVYEKCSVNNKQPYDKNICRANLAVGKCYTKLEEYGDAIKALEKARKIALPKGAFPDESRLAQINAALVSAYVQSKQADKAAPLIDELKRLNKNGDQE